MQIQIIIGLFFCHFLADYTHISTAWMLSAKRLGKPLFPIFIHAGIHTILMFLFLVWFTKDLSLVLKLSVFQWATHFLIDVWKGRMNSWFPALQSPTNKWHWVVFGMDQFFHAIVIIIMYYCVVK